MLEQGKVKATIYGFGGGFYRDYEKELINVEATPDMTKFTHTAQIMIDDRKVTIYKTSSGWMNWFGVEFL